VAYVRRTVVEKGDRGLVAIAGASARAERGRLLDGRLRATSMVRGREDAMVADYLVVRGLVGELRGFEEAAGEVIQY